MFICPWLPRAPIQIDKLLHTFVVLWPTWSSGQTSHQMNLNIRLEIPQDRAYVSPAMDVLYLQVEDTIAKSNTETIGEDDDEYDWGD